MVARGRVKNGVVVLDRGASFSEGQEVTVLAMELPPDRLSGVPLQPHSILDIPTVRVGAVLRPLTSNDDLLGEMLEGQE